MVSVGGINFDVRVNARNARQELRLVELQIRRFAGAARRSQTENRGWTDSLRAVPTAIAAASAALGASGLFDFGKETALLAARIEVLGTVLQNVGLIAGASNAQLRNLEQGVISLGITTRDARRSLSQVAQAELDLANASKLARVAQDAAVIAGINSSEAFERLVIAIQRNDVRLLRNLGIVINLNTVYEKFANQTGRTAKSLTPFEKRTLVLNEVLDKGRLIAGTYEQSMQDVGKQFTSLPRFVEEAKVAIGNNFLPVLRLGVTALTDFLRAFPEDKAFITPKTVANIVAFGSALLGIGAVVGGLKLAGTALAAIAALTNPIGAVTAALVLMGATAVTSFVNSSAAAEQFNKKLEETQSAAEALQAAQLETRRELEKVGGLEGLEPAGTNAKVLEEQIDRLILRFPKFKKQLEEIKRTRDMDALRQFFRSELPTAMASSEDSVNRLRHAQRTAGDAFFEAFRKAALEQELQERGLAGTTAEYLEQIDALIELKSFRDAERAAEVAEFDARTKGVAAVVEQNKEFVRLTPTLATLAEAYKRATGNLEGFNKALLFERSQEVQRELKNLELAANQALEITNKLETSRRNIFKNTEALILLDFTEQQENIRTEAVKTDAELRSAAEAFRAAQESESQVRLLQAQTQALALEKGEEREKALANARQARLRDITRIEEQTTLIISDGVKNRESILQAERLSREIATERIQQQKEELQRLIQVADLEAKGVSTRLIQVQDQLSESRDRARVATEGLSIALNRITSAIARRQNELLRQAGGDTIVATALGVSDPQLQRLNAQVQQVVDLQNTTLKKLEVGRARLVQTFSQQLNEEFRRIEQEEARILDRIRKIQAAGTGDEVTDRSFEGLDRKLSRAKDKGKEVATFLRELEADFKERGFASALTKDIDIFSNRLDLFRRAASDRAVPGLVDLTRTVEQFRVVLEKANSAAQVQVLERAFAFTLREKVVQSRNEVDNLRKALENFRGAGRRDAEAESRARQQERLNQLFEAGVDEETARREVGRIALEDREKLNQQEADLQKKLRESQEQERLIQAEVKNIDTAFAALATKQKAAIRALVDDQKELNALKIQELAIEQKALEAVQRRRGGSQAAAAQAGIQSPVPVSDPLGEKITAEIAAAREKLGETGAATLDKQAKVTSGLTEIQALMKNSLSFMQDLDGSFAEQVVAIDDFKKMLAGQGQLLKRALDSKTGGTPR